MMEELPQLLKDAAVVMCYTTGFLSYRAANKLVTASQPTLDQCIFNVI
jgi:hypothetical protein